VDVGANPAELWEEGRLKKVFLAGLSGQRSVVHIRTYFKAAGLTKKEAFPMEKEELKKTLNIGTTAQIGCVVRNLSETIKNYEEITGIGPFIRLDFRPEKSFIKERKSDDMLLKIGVAQLTLELSLELIEVVAGEPYHKDFLEKCGEGVQHLGFFTDDYDGVLDRAYKLAIPVLMWAETDAPGMGRIRAAYLDTYDKGGLFEVIEVTPPQ
jgi:hypothetical protein